MKPNLSSAMLALLVAASSAYATTHSRTSRVVYFWDDDIEKNVCLAEELYVDCQVGEGECFQETAIGFRQLYDRQNCRVSLFEENGF
ncbi:hypothetical protein [Pedobacter chitinilyticus]|uniref:Uncharacterized protein n=1 Tax=Pedobacter chitinilyticus TaxID=2233776 RepID=A0A443YVX2_9SPHI|nr:hypothetical protein [Pedobacter chitinilyticus]RWU08149.1 hypothetical protein DPV69_07145 [Pedobacter chitinilyticus]